MRLHRNRSIAALVAGFAIAFALGAATGNGFQRADASASQIQQAMGVKHEQFVGVALRTTLERLRRIESSLKEHRRWPKTWKFQVVANEKRKWQKHVALHLDHSRGHLRYNQAMYKRIIAACRR